MKNYKWIFSFIVAAMLAFAAPALGASGDMVVEGRAADTITIGTALLPDISGGADLGTTALEVGDIFVGNDKYVQYGDGQEMRSGWDSTNSYFLLGDGTNDFLRVTDGGTTGTFSLFGTIDLAHTAATTDDHAFEIDVDAAAFGDVKAIDINYTTGILVAGSDEAIILVNINEIGSTGGDIFALEVLATEGSATPYAIKAGVGVGPVHQDKGSFANPTKGTDNTTGASVTDTSIGFTQSPDTITDSNNGFGAFVVGEIVVVTGATTGANNTTYTITVATAGALTVTPQPNTVENDAATITVEGNVPAMFDGSSGTTTAIFESDSEYILIGAASAFEEIEIILTVGASGGGIAPTFAYSVSGAHTFTAFTPVDGTNGLKNSGIIAWDASDVSSHVANSNTSTFDILITRTRNTLTTTPILGYAKVASTTEYLWDASGDLTVNAIAAGSTIDTTDALTGEAKVITISGNDVLTVAQCRGTVILVTGAYTPVLPDVSGFSDSDGGICTFIATTAAVFSVDPNASDSIVLYDTLQTDGHKATSPGTLGASITFVGSSSVGWMGLRGQGIFVNGG